jgi:hypothetical protein
MPAKGAPMHRRSMMQLGGLALAWLATARPAISAVGKPWRTLLDGRSLKGWSLIGDANWTIKDGAAQADTGGIGFLVSDKAYANLQIRAEFWVSEEANSGIFIRCTNPGEITTTNAYEVNIFETRPDPAYATGAIVGVARVASIPKTGGRWNVMDIEARGDRFTVTVNGVRTVDGVRDAAHAGGRIALQYGAGLVKFRKVQVRPI